MKSIANFNKKAYVVLPFLCGKTTVVLEILYARMLAEVVKVIEVFIGFVHIFDEEHAHNMLDSWFISLQGITDLIGCDRV